MCNLVCSNMGRHGHIDYCRADDGARCNSAEVQHINERIAPDPDKAKDAIAHNLYWRRIGESAVLVLCQLVPRPCSEASKVTNTLLPQSLS